MWNIYDHLFTQDIDDIVIMQPFLSQDEMIASHHSINVSLQFDIYGWRILFSIHPHVWNITVMFK